MSFMNVMKSIQADALANGGSYIHYSQCIEPTATLINMLPYTANGICQALSAKWIAQHANGSSLWDWLCTPGTTNVKQSAIANLMINFTESVQRTGKLSNPTTRNQDTKGQFYQDFVTDKYLKLYSGLVRRSIVQEGVIGSIRNQLTVGGGVNAGRRLARRLNESRLVSKGSGSYVLISIMGNGGHAMAAFVGEDIAFFDPNFGEFWFPSHKQFYAFFLKFWHRSGYYKNFPNYYLMPYAKAV